MNTSDFSETEIKILNFIKSVESFTRKDITRQFPDYSDGYFWNFLTKCECHGVLLYEEGSGHKIVYYYLKEL